MADLGADAVGADLAGGVLRADLVAAVGDADVVPVAASATAVAPPMPESEPVTMAAIRRAYPARVRSTRRSARRRRAAASYMRPDALARDLSWLYDDRGRGGGPALRALEQRRRRRARRHRQSRRRAHLRPPAPGRVGAARHRRLAPVGRALGGRTYEDAADHVDGLLPIDAEHVLALRLDRRDARARWRPAQWAAAHLWTAARRRIAGWETHSTSRPPRPLGAGHAQRTPQNSSLSASEKPCSCGEVSCSSRSSSSATSKTARVGSRSGGSEHGCGTDVDEPQLRQPLLLVDPALHTHVVVPRRRRPHLDRDVRHGVGREIATAQEPDPRRTRGCRGCRRCGRSGARQGAG